VDLPRYRGRFNALDRLSTDVQDDVTRVQRQTKAQHDEFGKNKKADLQDAEVSQYALRPWSL
jgi:hypothetical protein